MKVRSSVPLTPMLLAGALVLAACGENTQSNTEATAVGVPTANAVTAACTPTVLQTLATSTSAYLDGDDEAFLNEIRRIVENQAVDADLFALKGIAKVGEARNAGRQTGTPAQGAAIIQSLLTCTELNVTATSVDYAKALTGDGALVGYLDRFATQSPAVTRDGNAGVRAPNNSFTTWLQSNYVVIFGYPIDGAAKTQYEWGAIRLAPAVNVGLAEIAICAPNDLTNRIFRVPSDGSPSSVLERAPQDFLTCADNVPPVSTASAGSSVKSWFAQRVSGFLPEMLLAQTATRTRTSSTSTAGSFSKFSVLTRTAVGDVRITVPNLSNIPDTRVNAPLWAGELTVSATSSLLTDPNVPGRSPGLTGARVTLRAVNNNGTPAEFSRLVNGVWVSTGLKELTATANSLGQLSFGSNVGLTKSGGYRLVFTSTYPNYPTQTVTSNGFNVRPK